MKFIYQDAKGAALVGGVYIDVTDDVRRQRQLSELNRRLEVLAGTDGLTGLPNRRVFEQQAEEAFVRAFEMGGTLSVLVLDVDDFKRRNDLMGHAAGDDALRQVGRILSEMALGRGMAARIGGEEFTMLLPGCDETDAGRVAEQILARIRQSVVGLTASVGVAEVTSTISSWQRMLAQADDAMYEAKRKGKDRVMLHGELRTLLLAETREEVLQARTIRNKAVFRA